MVKVVGFDVGGVLIRITHFWAEAARCANVTISPAVAEDASLVNSPFLEAYQSGEIGDSEYLRQLSNSLGTKNEEEALKVHNHIMVEPYAGVDQIVRSLNDIGLVTACLSNTNEPHWHDMFHSGRFPANEALQVRMASHLVGASKPDPKIFEAFEERLGCRGKEIVFFDDSRANIEAVRERGWIAFLIDPSQPTDGQIRTGLTTAGIQIPLV